MLVLNHANGTSHPLFNEKKVKKPIHLYLITLLQCCVRIEILAADDLGL